MDIESIDALLRPFGAGLVVGGVNFGIAVMTQAMQYGVPNEVQADCIQTKALAVGTGMVGGVCVAMSGQKFGSVDDVCCAMGAVALGGIGAVLVRRKNPDAYKYGALMGIGAYGTLRFFAMSA